MRYLDKTDKIDYLIKLIEKKNTGTSVQMAERLCVSERTMERYLALLRESGRKIGYSYHDKSYFFYD